MSSAFLQFSPLTAPVRAHIRNWSTHWMERHGNYMAPEAIDMAAIGTTPWTIAWSDLFESDANGFLNPLRAPWFESLPQTAVPGDIATLDAAFGPHPAGRALARFFLLRLRDAAWLRDQAGLEVSPMLPQELRAQGVLVPDAWNCENNRVRHERELAATTQLLTELFADAETTLLDIMGPPTATPPGSADTTPVPSPRTVNLVAVRQELTGFRPPSISDSHV